MSASNRFLRQPLALPLLALAILLVGCKAFDNNYLTLVQQSPDRRSTLRVEAIDRVLNQYLRITLIVGERETVIYDFGGDFLIKFAAIWWSNDSRVVGAFVWSAAETVPRRVAYDLVAAQQVDWSFVEDGIRQTIASTYALTPLDGDPLKWARTQGGQSAFIARYPPSR